MGTRRTGLMIIRAWFEGGSAKPLRAQVRQTSDVSVGFESEATLAEPELVLAEVKVFLESLSPE